MLNNNTRALLQFSMILFRHNSWILWAEHYFAGFWNHEERYSHLFFCTVFVLYEKYKKL